MIILRPDSWVRAGPCPRRGFPRGSSAQGMLARLTGLGPPVPRCTFIGRGPVLPIVDGLEGLGTSRYADLPVVHSERKFQSHPAVPPARLIVHAMKAPLRQLEWVASGTHYAPELLRLPLDTSKGCQGIIHNMRLQNMIELSCSPPSLLGLRRLISRRTQPADCKVAACAPYNMSSIIQYEQVHTSTYWYILVCTGMYNHA